MKKHHLLALLPLFFFACHQPSRQSGAAHAATSAALSRSAGPDSSVNRLSAEQQAAGWTLLFNGKNLDGWRGYQHKSIAAWDVENGTLHCNGHKKDAPPTDLITDSSYRNFELAIQWKISPASNSGIMFHVSEKYPQTFMSGPEYQIIDDKGWPGKLEPWQHTGCNYAMQVPDTIPVKPVGQWNTTRIVVKGAHVEHWLNGMKILQYELWSPAWEKQKASGKWKDDAAYGMSRTGHIALQYHGGDVWFRKIRLRVL
jgi:hypothetical protein